MRWMLAVTLLAGCALGREMRALLSLQRGVAETFGERGVSIRIDGPVLTVGIANSRRQELPDSERADFARQVALYVRHHLPDSLPISRVRVSLTSTSGGGGVTVSRTATEYVLPLSDPGDAANFPFTFACPGGDTVRVRFSGDSADVLLPRDARVHRLPLAVSASGARYSDGSLTFWNKGDSAFVMRGDSIVIRDCGLGRADGRAGGRADRAGESGQADRAG